jgi:hypothetical protein
MPKETHDAPRTTGYTDRRTVLLSGASLLALTTAKGAAAQTACSRATRRYRRAGRRPFSRPQAEHRDDRF